MTKELYRFLEEFEWYVEALYDQIQYQLCKEEWIFTDKFGKAKDRENTYLYNMLAKSSHNEPSYL